MLFESPIHMVILILLGLFCIGAPLIIGLVLFLVLRGRKDDKEQM